MVFLFRLQLRASWAHRDQGPVLHHLVPEHTALLLVQLLAKDPSTWTPVNQVGSLHEALDSWSLPASASAIAAMWGMS